MPPAPALHPDLGLADLAPEAAHFCLGVERFCRRDLGFDPAGCRIAVAVSGGADSLACLLCLFLLRSRLNCRLLVVHLDHGLRDESAAEALSVSALAQTLGLEFHGRRLDVARFASEVGCGLEDAGRRARMDLFGELRGQGRADWVALGHQLNDLAEDSLMRMLRGSGWPALAGMSGCDPERRIVRPLLLRPRAELEDFLSCLGLSWTDDASNRDPAYFRNRIRHRIMPLFLAENPSFLQTVARRWQAGCIDREMLDENLHPLLAALPASSPFVLEKSVLASLPKAMRLRLYRAVLERLGPGEQEASMLLALDAAWEKGAGGKRFAFPGKKIAELSKGHISFSPACRVRTT